VQQGRDGSRWFDVIDPEGNKIEFVQSAANAPHVPVNAFSNHIIHVGYIIHNRALEDTFYRTVLGFKPYWFGGMRDDTPTWISQQVPDGTDWLEYMVVGPPDGRGIPATMSAADAGVLDHFSLGVANVEAAYTLLWNGDRLDGQSNVPKIGRDAKWQLNLLDPDGTRAEVMEFHAIGRAMLLALHRIRAPSTSDQCSGGRTDMQHPPMTRPCARGRIYLALRRRCSADPAWGADLHLNELDYFETQGLSVLAYQNTFHAGVPRPEAGRYRDHPARRAHRHRRRGAPAAHAGAMGCRCRGSPGASTARLPDQLIAYSGYPDLSFSYRIEVTAEGQGFRVAVHLDQPLPPALVWQGRLQSGFPADRLFRQELHV
jgi:catechol 2,3-dioxygenase-like lactoylglutathione lyase family enzyme